MKLKLRKWLKRTFCVGAASLLMVGSHAHAQELITNGSLEAGPTGTTGNVVSSELGSHHYRGDTWGTTLPDGWTRTDARSWSVTDTGDGADPFPTANGDYAFRLDARISHGPHDALIQTGLPLVAGTQYTLNVDMWSEYTSQGALLNVDLIGDTGGTATINVIVGHVDATPGIETVTANFTPVTTDTYSIELYSDMGGGSNNHTWVDNISLAPGLNAFVLEVNTTTGATRMINSTPGDIDLRGYQITSPAGALDPIAWHSLDEQDGPSTVPGDTWEEGLLSSDQLLIEGFLQGSTLLSPEDSLSLGSAFDTSVFEPEEVPDLAFSFEKADGSILEGFVQYVEGGTIPGDYDNSGQVEQADLDLVLLNWGSETVPPGWENDQPSDPIGSTELDVVRTNWGNSALAPASASAVPEPTFLAWIGMGVAGWFLRRRNRWGN